MRCVALLCCFLPASAAWAQADPAADHYKAGVGHFKAGQFPEAIGEFRAADALRPSPALAFNIAQCFEKMADLPNAKLAYQDYLRRSPNAEDRASVETTIASIDARLAQAQRDNSVVVVPAAGASESSAALAARVSGRAGGGPNYTLAATLAGAGVAGLATGVVLNLISHQASQGLQNNGAGGGYYSLAQLQQHHDDASTFWTGALIGYLAGGVLAASGVVVGGFELGSHPTP